MEKQLFNLCKEGKLDELKEFLKNNPDINISANNEEAFKHTTANGYFSVLQLLLKLNPNINLQLLNLAIYRNCYQIIQTILIYQTINYKIINQKNIYFVPKHYLITF